MKNTIWATIAYALFSLGFSATAAKNQYNLAKFQKSYADSATGSEPVQYGNDGFVTQENRWVSDNSGPHWFEIELAVPMTIGSAHLYSGDTWSSAMANLSLQYHNGSDWIDIPGTAVSDNTLPELNLMFSSPITAQRFRLYTTDSIARIRELALYPPTSDGMAVPFGTDLDLNVAKLRQFATSSIDGDNYPGLAIDGYVDNSSAWASADTAGPHDFEVHFPQKEKVRGIQLYSGWDGQSGTQIQNFEVAYSNDATGWVVFDGGSISGNTELNLNLWFNSAANAQTVRVRSFDADQAVIRELVVFAENGSTGYPLWTDARNEAPPSQNFMDYEDSYYTLENRATGQNLSTSTNGASVTTAEPWFQVLLNLGTDTYRLCSKDSLACFEVSLASTNEGAAVVEGNYSAMPHQRWRLEDTGDGTHFRIVNVWSGMVLGLDGTNVVQQISGPEFSKHWKINYETHFPKYGKAAHFHFGDMFKPNWYYGWNFDQEGESDYGEYMPMQWGGIGSSTAGILRYQPEWYGRANNTTVLGFNEPDLHDQANIDEDAAAYQWPRMERLRLPLAGPVPAAYKGSWRQNYEALAAERGLRSEYMAVHWYSTAGAATGSPGTLINNMEYLYNLYGKPIVLTEFSTRNFNGTMTSWSRNHNYNFLAEFMWRAESLPWLKRWSLFEWGYGGDPDTTDANSDDPTDMNSPKLALHYNNDKTDPGWEDLMECGLLMAGWDGNASVKGDTAYIIHNKGRFLRLIDHPASNTVTTADVENRAASEQFILENAGSGRKYITGLSDGRRLSSDGSNVGLAAAGTTGASVEWELNEYQYGWFYIDHPSTGKRLRITSENVIDVAGGSDAYDNVRFRFIKHYLPITLTEVQPLPYSESFENGIGAWRYFDNQDKFWEVGSGGTPTAAAGPDGASGGDYYLFSEGHDAGSFVTNSVECVFDFSTTSTVLMGFDYHMYGGYIDFLALDVFDGSSWTSNVWIKTGPQHAGSDAAWSKAVVDLSAYAGNSEVTLRFRTANKLWSSADPAIDHIRIDDDAGNNAPVADGLNYTTEENTAVAVPLSGSDPDGEPLSYKITTFPTSGTLSGSAPNLTYTPNLEFHGTDHFAYTVDDGLATSPEAIVSITVNKDEEPPPSLPYAESFENGLGSWSQSFDDDIDWTLNSGYTDTTSTGPSGASEGSWYLYVENHDSATQYKTASVECQFDLSSVNQAQLSFDYHMYGSYIDFLAVDVSDGTTWTSNVWIKTKQQQFSSEDAWLNAVVDLTAYAGSDSVTIRFRSKQGQWHAADTAIDNIRVENPADAAYYQWAAVAFSDAPGGTDISISGNPDGDHLNNEQEWALVTDPMVPDAPSMKISISDPNFTVIYNRRNVDGVMVRASWASSITSTEWRLDGDGMTESSTGITGDVETVSATLPLDEDQKFIRIETVQ
ncbi:glycosyl hydrolase [Pontiellaceae bacterium B12219]|nr:glycosyl hydrolase [Pontiellaceae bacterium B12219]